MVVLADIEEARSEIKGIASRTPLLYSPNLSARAGREVYLKLENFQPVKVFKIRGATNKMRRLPKESLVVTASSGNHGFAVSYVARILGQRAVVCVPLTANPDKVNNIRSFGAEVIAKGESYEDAYSEARRIESQGGGTFVHAYEDPLTIAGQGTLGIELVEDLPDLDTVLVPIGGGGLISGVSTAVHSLRGDARVIGVQSANAPTMVHAFKTGEMKPPVLLPTVCDGLVTKMASEVTFRIIKENVSDVVAVPEEEIIEAVRTLLVQEHLLVEPSGAATVAALLNATIKPTLGKKVVAVVSGGNISIDFLTRLLAGGSGS